MIVASWTQIAVDAVILYCLWIIIAILKDIAAMERFNYHGAEKGDRN